MTALRSQDAFAQIAKRLKETENPFDSDKVRKARDVITDVPDIHEKAYRKLESELQKVRRSRVSRGILITGVAGSGKSHLISRLYRGRPRDVLFFQVEALPGGKGWLKQILQCIVNDLEQPVGPENEKLQLNVLIRHLIGGVKAELGISAGAKLNFDHLNKALEARCRQIERTIPDPLVRDVLHVLAELYKWQAPFFSKDPERGKKTQLAIQWLKGVMIDDEELSLIGVRSNFGDETESGYVSYLTVLRVFGMLTAGQAPIILAFDQLDTMEEGTINSLGNQLLELIGSSAAAPNYLVVTAGVVEQMDLFLKDRIITNAVADVVFKTRIDLMALGMEDCRKIVEKRMDGLLTPGQRAKLPGVADGLFPFTKEFLAQRLTGPIKPSPRGAIKVARSAFDEIQETATSEWVSSWPTVSPLVDFQSPQSPPGSEIVRDFLLQEFNKNVSELSTTEALGPIDQDNLSNAIRVLLVSCEKKSPFVLQEFPGAFLPAPAGSTFGVTKTSNLSATVWMVVENRGHWKTVGATLKKVNEFLQSGGCSHTVLFLRDAAAKKMTNWAKCNEQIAGLMKTGRFKPVTVERDAVVALRSLDKMRRDVPDYVIPSSRSHSQYKITEEDYADFLVNSGRFLDLSLFREAELFLESQIPGPPSPEAGAFVLARIEAKKIYAYNQMVLDWAHHHGRSTVGEDDRKAIESAVMGLAAKKKIEDQGRGEHRILKKV